MEIKLLPRPFGCIWLFLKIATLGLIIIPLRSMEKRMIRSMDDEGVVTQGGQRIRWAEVTSTQLSPARS